jgi:hypothetical protein
MSGIFPDSGVPAHLALNTVDVPTSNCQPGGELFHATSRCQPRFDPAAANAIMSELLNTVACAGFAYDCRRLDNLCRAIRGIICGPWAEEVISGDRLVMCREGAPVTIDPSDFLATVCYRDVPDLAQTCGVVDQLVIVTDPLTGCGSLHKTREATRPTYIGVFGDIATWLPVNTANHPLPESFEDPLLPIYNMPDLIADGGTDPLSRPDLDEARIANSVICRVAFENPCARAFDLEVVYQHKSYGTADEAYSRTIGIVYRYRFNGGNWFYSITQGTGQVAMPGGGDRALNTVREITTRVGFGAASLVELEIFMVFPNDNPAGQAGIVANTYLEGFAYGTPRMTLRPI